ncbi:hypothetical protein CYMTET_25514 [Cymbomonas tetramitiformis]|uniref:Reverse transcriptase RNase H-like domain-containing protein n=1 Tax=Cymbomonas tetramitiformis TaxID=36881 RepID=A0AAE0KZ38_9CHLO|nr:hypothetical protein CYMTET_25514 [Cymbomonas tetramitiformis]
MLPRERRESAAQDHAEGLKPDWEHEAHQLWETAQAPREHNSTPSRRKGRKRRAPATAAPVVTAEGEQHGSRYSCFKKEKPATPAAPEQTRSSGENNEAEQRSCGEDDETEQRSSGEAKQTKQTAAQATPLDEEDAEEVPQWIWDELTELKKVYADVTDANAVALAGVLIQDLGKGLQPIAFESKQFSSAEQNYHAGERAKGKPAEVPKAKAEVNATVEEKKVEKKDPNSSLDAGQRSSSQQQSSSSQQQRRNSGKQQQPGSNQ